MHILDHNKDILYFIIMQDNQLINSHILSFWMRKSIFFFNYRTYLYDKQNYFVFLFFL